MGLGRAFLGDLVAIKISGALEDASRVVEIGAQQLSDGLLQSNDLLDELYELFGRKRPFLGIPTGADHFTEAAPSSRVFWRSLGFDYSAIDYQGDEEVVSLDMNHDEVPARMRGAFDLVVNAGTTEHIANQDNAFRVIHDLSARYGVMYHEVPGGAGGDHGLISYNP